MKRLLMLALAVMLATFPVLAATYTLPDVLSGKTLPLSISQKEMTADWRTFSIGLSDGMGGGNVILAMMMASEGQGQETSSNLDFYTKGDTVECGKQIYLVAYRRPFSATDMMQRMLGSEDEMGEQLEQVQPASPETSLSLCLLNLQQIGKLLDVRPVDFDQEVSGDGETRLTTRRAQTESMSNLRQLALAMLMYVQDNDENFPSGAQLKQWEEVLSISEKLTRQPNTDQRYRVNFSLAGKGIGDIKDPNATPIFYEPVPADDGSRCVAYVDGHVARVSAEDWPYMQKRWDLQ